MNIQTTLDLLRNPVRREIVAILTESDPITRPELTAALADGDAETDDSETAPARPTRRVRIALHHNHLPKLADAGVVEYDAETVTGTSRLESLAEIVAPADSVPFGVSA